MARDSTRRRPGVGTSTVVSRRNSSWSLRTTIPSSPLSPVFRGEGGEKQSNPRPHASHDEMQSALLRQPTLTQHLPESLRLRLVVAGDVDDVALGDGVQFV